MVAPTKPALTSPPHPHRTTPAVAAVLQQWHGVQSPSPDQPGGALLISPLTGPALLRSPARPSGDPERLADQPSRGVVQRVHVRQEPVTEPAESQPQSATATRDHSPAQESAAEVVRLKDELASQGRVLAAALGRQRERTVRGEERFARLRRGAVGALSTAHCQRLQRRFYDRLRRWQGYCAWNRQRRPEVTQRRRPDSPTASQRDELRRELEATKRNERSLRKVCTVLERSLASAVAERDSLRSKPLSMLLPEERALLITRDDPPHAPPASPRPPQFSPPEVADALYDSLRGTCGADEDAAIRACAKVATAEQWQDVLVSFHTRRPAFFGGDLWCALVEELPRRAVTAIRAHLQCCGVRDGSVSKQAAPLRPARRVQRPDADGRKTDAERRSPAARRAEPAAAAEAKANAHGDAAPKPEPAAANPEPHVDPVPLAAEAPAVFVHRRPAPAPEPPAPPPPRRPDLNSPRPPQHQSDSPVPPLPAPDAKPRTPRSAPQSDAVRGPQTAVIELSSWRMGTGMAFRSDGGSAVLVSVAEGSPAADAGVGRCLGMAVTHCDGRKVHGGGGGPVPSGCSEIAHVLASAQARAPCTLTLRLAPSRDSAAQHVASPSAGGRTPRPRRRPSAPRPAPKRPEAAPPTSDAPAKPAGTPRTRARAAVAEAERSQLQGRHKRTASPKQPSHLPAAAKEGAARPKPQAEAVSEWPRAVTPPGQPPRSETPPCGPPPRDPVAATPSREADATSQPSAISPVGSRPVLTEACITCRDADGDLIRFTPASGGGLQYSVNGRPRPASYCILHNTEGGLEFPDIGRGVLLAEQDRPTVLPALRAMAERAGAGHNIPV